MTRSGLAFRHDTDHDGLRGAGRLLRPEEETAAEGELAGEPALQRPVPVPGEFLEFFKPRHELPCLHRPLRRTTFGAVAGLSSKSRPRDSFLTAPSSTLAHIRLVGLTPRLVQGRRTKPQLHAEPTFPPQHQLRGPLPARTQETRLGR